MFRKIIKILAHVLFWFIGIYIITRLFGIATVEVFANNENGKEEFIVTYDEKFTWAAILTISLSAIIFYSNIFCFLKSYFQNKNFKAYIFKLIILIIICIVIDVIINRYFNYSLTIKDGLFAFPSFGLHMGLFIFFIALSFAYAFTLEWNKNEKLKNEIAKEKLKTELNFLKSQINPHFLFNTLNNLYSIAQKHEVSELSTGINELSNLMRYMLYESNAEFVSLKKEVDYLDSFIEIQKLRHDESDELIVNFEKTGNFNTSVIAPMILLPFVENAFKHGFSLNDSSIINLKLEATNTYIYFRVRNKAFKQHNFSDKTSGIGLENVTRRLNLIYPKRHQLIIKEEDGYFTTELSIHTHD